MMRVRLLNVLLLAALVLALSRLWLFLGESPAAPPALDAGSTSPAAMPTSGEQKAVPAEIPPEAFDLIVARDLFSSTRGVVPPAPAATVKQPAKPQPAPKLTLYGVVILDGEKAAFLQEGAPDGRTRKVRENENFAGGVVSVIKPDGITFVFEGNEINVPLRTPKTGAGLPRDQETVTGGPRVETPVAFPRRLTSPGLQQGPLSAPGRPASAPAMRPPVVLPVERGSDVTGDEEFPEESMPGGEQTDIPEEEEGE